MLMRRSLTCSIIYQPTHSSTHTFIYPFTYLPTHSYTHTFIYSLTHLPTHSSTHSLIYPFIHQLTHSSTHTFIYSLTHLSTRSSTHSLIYPLTHQPTHSFNHSFINPSISPSGCLQVPQRRGRLREGRQDCQGHPEESRRQQRRETVRGRVHPSRQGLPRDQGHAPGLLEWSWPFDISEMLEKRGTTECLDLLNSVVLCYFLVRVVAFISR